MCKMLFNAFLFPLHAWKRKKEKMEMFMIYEIATESELINWLNLMILVFFWEENALTDAIKTHHGGIFDSQSTKNQQFLFF